MNELTKRKISIKLKNRKHSATHNEHIKQSLKGRELTKEHKENISKSLKEYHKNKPNNP